MQDLTLISKRHQRYEHGVPTMGLQQCSRTMVITNADFIEMMGGMQVSPSKGFLVRLYNTDFPSLDGNYPQMMEPKLMTLESDSNNKIELKGVALKYEDITTIDFSAYSITLHLIDRKVAKCVLHMLDRGIDIEYLDIQPSK